MTPRVNLRLPDPPGFGDDATRDRFMVLCDAARDRQTVKYAVAPQRTLKLHDGRELPAGAEVKLSDFPTGGGNPAPWTVLRDLVESWTVLEADVPATPPPNAA